MSQSSRPSVKRPPRSRTKQTWRRHLDGWQLAIVTIVIAWGSAIVMVPRPVTPDELPLPRVEPRARERVERRDRELAAAASNAQLEDVVRKVGSRFRVVGRLEASNDPKVAQERRDIALDVREAIAAAPDSMLKLRAFQTEAFLAAFYEWA